MNKPKFTFAGGDQRSVSACSYISSSGFSVDTFLLEKAELPANIPKRSTLPDSDCYVLGMPAVDRNLLINSPLSERSLSFGDFVKLIPKGSFVTGGLIPEDCHALAKEHEIILSDYYSEEELQIRNSVPTAEGAIETAMREMPVTISDSKPLIIGCGRIAKSLIPMLKGLGASVSVCTGNPDSATWCSLFGINCIMINELSEKISSFDLIFNTAPAKVLAGHVLDFVRHDALIIDLASRPGGVDTEKASEKRLKVIWALGLPGKCAPVSAGRIIGHTVLNLFNGR